MAPIQHMVPESNRDKDACQSYSCYFGLGLGPCCHECSVDSDYSELVVDCGTVVDIDMEVVDTEWQQHKDTDNMAWEPSETDTRGGHLPLQHLSPLLSFS